jgi:multiple sugar transport system substrate-binding protein
VTRPDKSQSRQFGGRWMLLLVLAWLLAGCQPELLEPPRYVTLTAQAQATATPPLEPVFSEAPTATASAPLIADPAGQEESQATPNPRITLWIDETSPAHSAVMAQIIGDFTAQTGIQVEMILVSAELLPKLVQTAVISGTLPDLVLHPVEYSVGWAQQGILDSQAATGVVGALGRGTFDPAALAMVTVDQAAGLLAAVPSHGWQQLIIYRQDWFTELGLNPPGDYESLIAAAETIFQPDSIVSGIVIPTDSNLVTTQQVFEFIAAANGCELADARGEVSLLHPACLAALDYYRELVNFYSPIGVQTDTSALNAYLAGRTGIIMASPAVLPALAGLDETYQPSCPACATADYLGQNSGILTRLQGSGDFAQSANFGELNNLGLTTASQNKEAAQAFASYWFSEAYLDWLSVDPERKVPMRRGTPDQPQQFLSAWQSLPLRPGQPTLSQVYGQELVDELSSNVITDSRWGFNEGQGGLVTTIYEELVLSPLLQEMLSGYFTSSQTIIEMYRAVVALIPNYQFAIETEPTASP